MTALKPYLRLMRPHQWLKNLFIGLPLIFGYKLDDLQALTTTLLAFFCFSLTASAVYIYNDARDLVHDRNHPLKKNRPLASGAVGLSGGYALMAFLIALAGAIGFLTLPGPVLALIGLYLVLNLAYSLGLKHLSIMDVMMIAIFFVIRVYTGALAIQAPVSHWLILMTFLLALFLALAKRRDDLVLIAEGERGARPAVDGYNMEFVSVSLMIMAAVTIVCYVLYTVSPQVQEMHGRNLYLSVGWVIAGLLRYLQVTLVKQESGSPTYVLIHDLPLKLVVGGWVVTVVLVLYGEKVKVILWN